MSNYGTKEATEAIWYLNLLQIDAVVLRELCIIFVSLQNVYLSSQLLSLRKSLCNERSKQNCVENLLCFQ